MRKVSKIILAVLMLPVTYADAQRFTPSVSKFITDSAKTKVSSTAGVSRIVIL